jgi:hypothetical protein
MSDLGRDQTPSSVGRRLQLFAAILATVVLTACGPAVTVHSFSPAPQNLGRARRIVLVAGSPESVSTRFKDEIRADGIFDVEDSRASLIRLDDLGEGELTGDAKSFRAEWPAART